VPDADLPFIDEHRCDIAADVDRVWAELLESADSSFLRPTARRFARLVGCEQSEAAGPRPLAEGSTIPGFRVAVAVPPSELVLAGRHRFAAYSLTFRLEPLWPRLTRVHAETRASFPGVAGGVYRLLVITLGGHAVAVRRMLGVVKRQAEWAGRAAS
jgi:hypothetical protein